MTPPSESNPLLAADDAPAFSRVEARHVMPAVETALAAHKAAVQRAKTQAPTLEALMLDKARADFALGRVWAPVGHLSAVRDTPEMREAVSASEPLLVEHDLAEAQDAELFARLEALHAAADLPALPVALRRAAEHLIRDFRLRGVGLPEDKQARLRAVVGELSTLSTDFSNAVLDAVDAWTEVVTDPAIVAGIPAGDLSRMAAAAKAKELDGWLIDLRGPTVTAVLSHATDRGLRERVYAAFATRASEVGPNAGRFDNGPRIERIMALRLEAANLLGFPDAARFAMATKMVRDPAEAAAFLRDLAARARPVAERELAEMRAFAAAELGLAELQAWDLSFVAEALRKARYDLDEETVRPFFPADAVMTGLFTLFERVFGITMRPVEDVDVWHPDAQAFDVVDGSGAVVGGVYLDLYARQGKRGGAWMDVCRPRFRDADRLHHPVAFVTCNFAPGADGGPALLRHDEVLTLLHEFGHALHHLLTEVDLPSVGGISGVEWDAVELPSQLMENFAWDRRALALLSGHHETGEPLPDALFDKMLAARGFNGATRILRQVEFALFDLELHAHYDPAQGARPDAVLQAVADEVAVFPPWPLRRTAHSFTHIFAGGYAAGYYSYLWAEVMSLDAFERFEEAGVVSAEAGADFRLAVLSQGASRPALESFTAFRGREPKPDALLRRYGLAA